MNRSELRAEIARVGVSNREIAYKLGISEQTFYNKLGGTREFKESEIKKLVEILSLTPEKVDTIFLS